MCGIAGHLGNGSIADVRAVVDALRHRGPDAVGFHVDEARGLVLGHARLSVLDHEGGGQPMATADGQLVVVFNGEIYNHRALRRFLEQRGHAFRSDHADTEVLLHGYREWGEALPERLNGMWAFALYDAREGRLFLSRDRFGKKPLYYSRQGETFAFASELHALLRHGALRASQSVPALQKFFAYGFIPAPHSLYGEVRKLPAGHNLILEAASRIPLVRRYWEYVPEPGPPLTTAETAARAGELRELLSRAVRRRMEADVPLGVLLSGGIDSSSVAALAAEAYGGPGRLQTFSIGFEESSFDESGFSRLAAEHCGSEHHLTTVSCRQVREELDRMLEALDEPMGDCSLLPTYVLCRETRRRVTVALGGDGADELFAGYDPFRALRLAELYQRWVPRPLHMGIRLAASWLPVSGRNMSLDFRLNRALRAPEFRPALWNPLWMSPLTPAEVGDLLGVPCAPEAVYAEAIEAWDNCPAPNPVDRTIQFYIKLYLQDDILTKVDRASMAHALEVRSPYLDPDLVDFVRRLPTSGKYHRGRTKVLLRQALEPVLPRAILRRPKKGFGLPLTRWFRDWEFRLENLHGVLDDAFIRRRIDSHRRGATDERLFLWNVVVLEHFLGRHPAREPNRSPHGRA
ncbi:MAG: asparagine synthase (glutamine-hydrolyzing) [Lentisphaeria bacterium]|nr:asparagine synthase (glutamine-hydrolyzing) [Lentisphaeria bacterium]